MASDDDEPFDPEIPTPAPAPAPTSRTPTLKGIHLQDEIDRKAAQDAALRISELEGRVAVLEQERTALRTAVGQWQRFRRYLVAWIDLDRGIAADGEGVRRQWRTFRKFLVTWLRERD